MNPHNSTKTHFVFKHNRHEKFIERFLRGEVGKLEGEISIALDY